MQSKYTTFSSFSMVCRGKLLWFDRPCVMGILNATPDSFYDGGRHQGDDALLCHARWLLDEGADIIDIGVVSSRPGAQLLDPHEEAARLRHVVTLLRRELGDATLLSADTCYPLPATAAIEAGADIINDISGGQFDEQMFPTIAALHVPYVLSHTRGLPSVMQHNTDYDDLLRDIQYYFSAKLDTLARLGIADIILDPGFGFAKTVEQNYRLLAHLTDLSSTFRQPLLVGLSRKSMIYRVLDTTPDTSLNGTTVLNTLALERGARMLRVHDPRPAREAITLLQAINTQQSDTQ